MRVPEEPVCIHLFGKNPDFSSLHLKSPFHVVPPLSDPSYNFVMTLGVRECHFERQCWEVGGSIAAAVATRGSYPGPVTKSLATHIHKQIKLLAKTVCHMCDQVNYVCICLFVIASVCLSIYLSVFSLSVCLNLPACLSVFAVYPSPCISLTFFLSLSLFCLANCLSSCLSVCLSVCPPRYQAVCVY